MLVEIAPNEAHNLIHLLEEQNRNLLYCRLNMVGDEDFNIAREQINLELIERLKEVK